VVFGDRGDEVVERENAEVLVGGAQLVLQFGRAPLGTPGDASSRSVSRCAG